MFTADIKKGCDLTYRTNFRLPEGRMGEQIVREFGMNVYTLLYLKWITYKDLPYNTGDSIQCYVAAWMGGDLGGE